MPVRFRYVGVRVVDMKPSLEFYTKALGMEVVSPLETTAHAQGRHVELRSPDSSQLLELNWYAPGSRHGPEYVNGEDLDHLAFECDDVGRTVEELTRRGVEVLIRPREVGEWEEAFVQDPNGIWIELLSRRAQTRP
jgi:lactoylglutathione lyase